MFRTLISSALALSLAGAPALADDEDRLTLGWLEHVRVQGADLELDAKLDTGAKTSSIHAEILEAPDREDFDEDAEEPQEIVFKLINEDDEERTVQSDIARWAAIKTKKGGLIHRPVVVMEFCLGGTLVEGEVTLADRGNFNYETLVGRNMLEEADILVDASDIYTKRADCEDDED